MRASACTLLIGLSLVRGILSFQSPHRARSISTRTAPHPIGQFQPVQPQPRIPSPSSTTALPLTLTPALQVAAKAGLTAVAAQWWLGQVVFRSPKFPQFYRDTADYTAHSVVALALMILLSYKGVLGWWTQPSSLTGVQRLLAPSATGQWMAAVVLGCFALWDIPTSFQVPALRKPDVIGHHCVMMILAAIGCTWLPMEYIIYYFGVVELSSIPLILYDQVAHWMEAIKSNSKNVDEEDSETHALEKIQGNLGIVAALAFTSIRVVSFTKVTLRNFLPDCFQALSTAVLSPSQKWAIRFLAFACGGFTLLQWYWFSQMVTAFRKGDV